MTRASHNSFSSDVLCETDFETRAELRLPIQKSCGQEDYMG